MLKAFEITNCDLKTPYLFDSQFVFFEVHIRYLQPLKLHHHLIGMKSLLYSPDEALYLYKKFYCLYGLEMVVKDGIEPPTR